MEFVLTPYKLILVKIKSTGKQCCCNDQQNILLSCPDYMYCSNSPYVLLVRVRITISYNKSLLVSIISFSLYQLLCGLTHFLVIYCDKYGIHRVDSFQLNMFIQYLILMLIPKSLFEWRQRIT